MKIILTAILLMILILDGNSQVTDIAAGNYKNINITAYSPIGDNTRVLILLHEVSNGTMLNANFAIGTITALRGSANSLNRVNIGHINSASAYDFTSGNVTSLSNDGATWVLKSCIFDGKKYLAIEVPFANAFHDQGYKFTGWTVSTGQNMVAIPFQVGGNLVNQNVLTSIENFVPNQTESHDVQKYYISGDVGIGTMDTKGYKLAVAGAIVAESVKVSLKSLWPDYVFTETYKLPSLLQIEQHIKEKGHLPDLPSAAVVNSNGIDIGEINVKLVQKIEELTLHMINMQKEILQLREVSTKGKSKLKD